MLSTMSLTTSAFAATIQASIPSPSQNTWHLGPLPLRAYAIAIIIGIAAAIWIGQRRLMERTPGGHSEDILDIAFWAVPFGIIGARIYHVTTTPAAYFGANGQWTRVFEIWQGGLGIWGGIAGGALGAWIACRRLKLRFPVVLDALAPALLVAQAIGRVGNYFNQELFGSSTTLPWGLQIDAAHLPAGYAPGTLFHPTFLYELLWNLAAFAVLIYLDKRLRLGHGRVFFAYVGLYCLGRVWIEMLRIDTAVNVLGLRLNVWVSILLLIAAVVGFVLVGKKHPTREGNARYSDDTDTDTDTDTDPAATGSADTDADPAPAAAADNAAAADGPSNDAPTGANHDGTTDSAA
jgi:prolipoprotein diacylglyceryl transferase